MSLESSFQFLDVRSIIRIAAAIAK